MSGAVLAALLSGGLSLAGVIVTALLSARKTENDLKTAQAVTDAKLEELTRQMRDSAHFTRRLPVVEEQIKVLSGEIRDLKRYHNPIGGKEAGVCGKNWQI